MSPRIEINTYLDKHGRAVIRTVVSADDGARHLAAAPDLPAVRPTRFAAPAVAPIEAQSA